MHFPAFTLGSIFPGDRHQRPLVSLSKARANVPASHSTVWLTCPLDRHVFCGPQPRLEQRLTRRQHSVCVSYPLYSQTHTTTTLSVCIISTVFTDSHDDNTQCVYIVSTVFTDSHDDNTQCVYHTTIPWPSSSPFTAYLGRGSRLASMLLSVLFSFPFPLTFLQRLSPSNAPSTLVVLSYLPILPNRPTTSHCDSPLKPTNYIAL